jgi:hypothetical protein
MSRYVVQLQQLSSIPLAVIRRPVRAAELSRVVPECCGLVWNAVRAQKTQAGRNVAIYWDGTIRLEVGVELRGPFAEQGDVVRSATPRGVVASITHFGPYSGPRRCARSGSRLVQSRQSTSSGSELGDLRPLAARVERRSVSDSHGCLLPAGPGVRASQLESPSRSARAEVAGARR